MMNSPESRVKGKSTPHENGTILDRIPFPRESSHAVMASEGLTTVRHRFLIKRLEKVRNLKFGERGDSLTS